jgi:hypothetical protein
MSIFFWGIVCTSAAGRTIHVDDDGPADFNNIQAAVDDSNDGDFIIVADGVYTGDGNRDIDFLGKAITLRSEKGPQNCIIDCQGSQASFHRGFCFLHGEDANSVLEGFTISKAWWHEKGGGIYCDNAGPTIRNCIIKDNHAYSVAGGMFESWTIGSGGGIYGSTGPIINCLIVGNFTGNEGGGLYLCSGPIINCTISDNRVSGWYEKKGLGYEYYIYGYGGGLQECTGLISNCIIWGNWAVIVGTENFRDCSIPQYSCYPGASGGGNVGSDPLMKDRHNGDYHLKSQAGRWDANLNDWVTDANTSPCIDAGNLESPIGNEPFPNGGWINMGVYGGTAEASKSYFGGPVCEIIVAGDVNGDCIVNFKDYALMALHWQRDENQ